MKDKNRLDLDVQEKWLDETYPNLPYVPDPDLVQLAYVLIARAQELEARVAELEAKLSIAWNLAHDLLYAVEEGEEE